MKRTPRLLLVAALAVSSFLCGFTYQDIGTGGGARGLIASVQMLPTRLATVITANLGGPDTELPPTETYWSVYSYLDANYYGSSKPDTKQLTYSAVRGMLAALGDRYTRFLDPEEHKQMQQDNQGDFEGIGAELDVKEGRIYIKEPIADSPAVKAGLKAGDVILKVDDHLIQGLDITEVVKKIRGPRNTTVKLTIKRDDVAEPMEFAIKRGIIPLTIVKSRMEDDASKIGYISLRQFNEKSDQQIEEALTKLEAQGMRGLVFDLRGNPGGLLDVAVDIGSRFIRDGDIVIIQNKGGRRSSLPVEPSKHAKHRLCPLVVLIDQGSASASEIVAGAIKDHKAGTIVGTDSFGKGLVQTIINLEDGSAVSITTAKYLTPSGNDVNKHKIHPDIVVEPSDDDVAKENDVQLKRAVQVLRERLGATQAHSGTAKREKS